MFIVGTTSPAITLGPVTTSAVDPEIKKNFYHAMLFIKKNQEKQSVCGQLRCILGQRLLKIYTGSWVFVKVILGHFLQVYSVRIISTLLHQAYKVFCWDFTTNFNSVALNKIALLNFVSL